MSQSNLEVFFEVDDDDADKVIPIGEEATPTDTDTPTPTDTPKDEGTSEPTSDVPKDEATDTPTDTPEGTTDPVVDSPTPETPETPQDATDPTSETISSLRQMLREQAKELEVLKGQSGQLQTKLTESGVIDESDLEPNSQDSNSISEEKGQLLSLLAETMTVSPQYPDFADICSQANFDLAIDALAKMAVQEEGGTLTQQVANVTEYVWGLSNPYKFIYDIVRENHPDYREPDPAKKEADQTASRQAPTPPPSVGKVAGGSSGKSDGWTAAKIDALDEEDLHKVPEAVYSKYMQNLL